MRKEIQREAVASRCGSEVCGESRDTVSTQLELSTVKSRKQ